MSKQQLSAAPAATGEKTSLRKYLGLGGGIALEWYDWQIYGLMAVFMAPHFFPADDRITSTLSALAVFAVGFIVRPISGAIFGPIADRIGHKTILMYSISAMAVCSLAIGFMPGFETIGPLAGVLVLVARLVQGVSTGIEQPAANAAALELAKPGRQGFFSGVVNGSFNQGGNLLASLVAFLTALALGGEVMNDWGWRLPFIIGGIAGFFIFFMRKSLPETGAAVATNVKADSTKQVWQGIWKHRLGVVAIIFVVGGTMIANYSWTTGLPSLANSVFLEDPAQVFAVTTGLMFLMVLCGPVAGWLADRFGSSRIYLILRIALIPAYFLMLLYTQPGIGVLAAVMIGGGLIVALNQVLFNYITATLMPPEIRTTGVALGYGIAVTVFGGTASYVLVWAQTQNILWAFALYGAIVCSLSVVTFAWARSRGHVHTEGDDPSSPVYEPEQATV